MGLPLPTAQFEEAPFWTGGADGELLITRCTACRSWLHPPMPVCRFCHSTNVAPEPVSGAGTVFTFTVNHQPWTRDLDVPYVLAIVELAEDPGLHVTTRLVDVEPHEVSIGAAVEVTFAHAGDVWLPLFRLTGKGGDGS